MKKDRKVKSTGMSDRDKNLLFIVGGILLVVLVVQFGFRNFLAENKAQKAEKAALEAELKELDVIQKNEKEYTAQTEEWKKKTKEYYKEFPAMVKARDQILYASDMEKRYDSLRITKVSMEAGELVAENQEARSFHLWRTGNTGVYGVLFPVKGLASSDTKRRRKKIHK